MASSETLRGTELIDCAKANQNKGVEVAAQRCGYPDIASFEQELRSACSAIGIEIQHFSDLSGSSYQTDETDEVGVEVAPETPSQL
jgi:hypothetical protein